jgi:hypothetical protein
VSTEEFNMSMRKFLKQVGVTSQQEIESAVRKAEAAGKGANVYNAKVVLTIDGLDIEHIVTGEIQGGAAS